MLDGRSVGRDLPSQTQDRWARGRTGPACTLNVWAHLFLSGVAQLSVSSRGCWWACSLLGFIAHASNIPRSMSCQYRTSRILSLQTALDSNMCSSPLMWPPHDVSLPELAACSPMDTSVIRLVHGCPAATRLIEEPGGGFPQECPPVVLANSLCNSPQPRLPDALATLLQCACLRSRLEASWRTAWSAPGLQGPAWPGTQMRGPQMTPAAPCQAPAAPREPM